MSSAPPPDDAELTPDSTQPTRRPKVLDRLLEPDVDLDQAFERLLGPPRPRRSDPSTQRKAEPAPMRSIVPGDAFASDDITLAVLLTSVLTEYEDIDRLLENLREHEASDGASEAGLATREAIISEAELADPEALSRALAPLDTERQRFELLFDSAHAALDRLDVYELSKMPSQELVRHMRDEENLRTVQSAVGFLRSLHAAAESFEAMALPETHIRDYLTHLYRMGDWNEMARLVSILELAVSQLHDQLHDADVDVGTPQEAT
ncbi:MAG: hypothetical protein AAGC60_19675 [Acidobacteriota bacterium]